MNTRKNITLKHLHINGEKQIGIKFYPDKMIQTVIKGLPNAKWSNRFSMVYIKNTPDNLNHIFNDFKGIAWVNTGSFFNIKKARRKKMHQSLLMVIGKENYQKTTVLAPKGFIRN